MGVDLTGIAAVIVLGEVKNVADTAGTASFTRQAEH